MEDELFELRNYFYLGNFSAAVTEGTTIAVDSGALKIERDVILARIAIAEGKYDQVISSVNQASAPVAMQAMVLLANYRKDPGAHRDIAVLTLKEWLADRVSASNPTLLYVAAIVFSEAGDFDEALRCAHNGGSLEHSLLKVQLLIKIDRADAASKEVDAMKRVDEDHTLSQLAMAWVGLATSDKAKIQESLYIYSELLERHGSTDLILNGIAACHLALRQVDDADRVLQEAIAKNPNYPDTLVNMIAVAQYKSKPAELVSKYMEQLKKVDPYNSWLLNQNKAEQELMKLVQNPPVNA